MTEETNKTIFGMLTKTYGLAIDTLKFMLYLKQDTEEFFDTIRRDFQKRLKIHYFEDDGSGELSYNLKYKHWYYIPFYFIFKDRKRILGESAIIVAEEYLFKLTGRRVKKGYTDFLSTG